MALGSVTSPSVLVTGLGKTGTSGVYTSIKQGLQRAGIRARTFFEPADAAVLHDHFRLAPDTPVLTKVILQDLRKLDLPPSAFERRVMTVRDPRDTAISALLFRPLITAVLRRVDDAAIGRFVDALRQKERDPASISVVELYRLTADLQMGAPPHRLMMKILDVQQRLIDDGDFHLIRYEDFVAGRLDDLSRYLGVEVENVSAQDSALYGHVSRSEGSGSFRSWFTPDDLVYFDARWGSFLDRWGYPREVELDPAPVIDPATSSEYVLSRVQVRREMLAGKTRRSDPDRPTASADWPAVYAELTERGADGDAVSCVRAARLVHSGRLGHRTREDALRWARDAAVLGSIDGMQLVVALLADATEPAEVRDRLGWQRELAVRQSQVDLRLAAELDATRRSTSFRLGNALVRAAQSPRGEVRGAARELRALWRERRDHHERT